MPGVQLVGPIHERYELPPDQVTVWPIGAEKAPVPGPGGHQPRGPRPVPRGPGGPDEVGVEPAGARYAAVEAATKRSQELGK